MCIRDSLKSQEEYLNFAKRLGDRLCLEEKKIYVQEFVKELLVALLPKLTSKEYQEIYNKSLVLLSQKQKDEKGAANAKKKKEKAPTLNASKAAARMRVGEDFGEYDEDEEEEPQYGKGKFNEDDFMQALHFVLLMIYICSLLVIYKKKKRHRGVCVCSCIRSKAKYLFVILLYFCLLYTSPSPRDQA
eukprot:TRINITY_DN136_c0_g1_i3.p1 TRINITY_DN136_c0_g1~~TRINITY_DN136_c0_g1_i3.p1  ORF type:complete len:188 (-),score=57.65 TRINITY_DN136_c0_g1_i3:58-621(-)